MVIYKSTCVFLCWRMSKKNLLVGLVSAIRIEFKLLDLQSWRFKQTMKLLIAGASGLVGQALVNSLKAQEEISVLGRSLSHLKTIFPEDVHYCTWDSLESEDAHSYDALINLCGKNIADSRWTAAVKKELISSRVDTSKVLIDWAAQQKAKPHFYCANAIGIYGMQDKGDQGVYTEDTPVAFDAPPDFLSEIGVRWQRAAEAAEAFGMKVTITRFAVVLKKDEGMLKKLSPAYKFGLGSIIGDGQQVLSWVHIDDVVGAYKFLLSHPELTGAYNICAPDPVAQKDFARLFAQALHRPLFLRTPQWVIRLLFGEMGNSLINQGQRVAGKKIIEAGYRFQYPDLKAALEQEFRS